MRSVNRTFVNCKYFCFGLFFLYRWVKRKTNSTLKALLAVVFLFCAPAYTYYQAGFLPTVPALAFGLMGYYFFFRYLEKYQFKYWVYTLIALMIAALIRSPFGIVLVAVLLHSLIYSFWRSLPWKHLLLLLLPLLQ